MKKGFLLRIFSLILIFESTVFFAASPALACTAFRMPLSSQGHVLIGRNFDWDYGHGLILINKRGVAKSSFALHATDTAEWTSTYGSLTFNQAGRELPYGGLNEKGLMIEVLWLGWTAWPVTAAPSMNEVQWIQYQLDTRSSIQDLAAHLDDVRILPAFAKVHFFACDASGECATIEGLGNHIKVHTGASLPIPALTNDTYATSTKYADKFLQSGTCPALDAKSSRSLDRFTRAACGITQTVLPTLDGEISRASSLLDAVAQDAYTKWQIVYDLTAKTISIRTQEAPALKTISMSAFDFSCAKPVQMIDLNYVVGAANSTDVTPLLSDYTQSANRSIVEKSLLNGFAHLPQAVVDQIVAFPDTMKCVAPW